MKYPKQTDNYNCDVFCANFMEIDGRLIALEKVDGKNIASIEKTETVGIVDTYTITYTDGSTDTLNITNGAPGKAGKSAYEYAKEGGYTGTEAEFTAALSGGSVSAHNIDSKAHFDIRNRLDNIDAIKLSITDVVNDLNTNNPRKPLSAAQGMVLRSMIGNGGGGQADMAQNDPDHPGYVLNRTHWKEEKGGVVIDTTVSFKGQFSTLAVGSNDIKEGENYVVTWDGTPYECVAFNAAGSIFLGNASYVDAGANSGEPFGIEVMSAELSTVYLRTGVVADIAVKIEVPYSVTYHKIPEEYLPGLCEVKTELMPTTNIPRFDEEQFYLGASESGFTNEILDSLVADEYVHITINDKAYVMSPEISDTTDVRKRKFTFDFGTVTLVENVSYVDIAVKSTTLTEVNLSIYSIERKIAPEYLPDNVAGITVVADPGQLIVVKEVDENGKPTAWEAVDRECWVEGETIHKLDGMYLPDGVPYIEKGELVEILPLCQPPFVEDMDGFVITNPPTLVAGESYVVNWNGIEYECVGQDLTAMIPGAVLIGNGEIVGMPSNNEPFYGLWMDEDDIVSIVFAPLDGATELTLSISKQNRTINKLDTRLLPEEAINNTLIVKFGETDDKASHSFMDIFCAMLSGKAVYFLAYGLPLPLVKCDEDYGHTKFESIYFDEGDLHRVYVELDASGHIFNSSRCEVVTLNA